MEFKPGGYDATVKKLMVAVNFFLLVSIAMGIAGAGGNEDAAHISVHQLKKMLHHSDVVIIDVRRFRDWWRSSKKILTAVRENPAKVAEWIQQYPKDKSLIFYCA